MNGKIRGRLGRAIGIVIGTGLIVIVGVILSGWSGNVEAVGVTPTVTLPRAALQARPTSVRASVSTCTEVVGKSPSVSPTPSPTPMPATSRDQSCAGGSPNASPSSNQSSHVGVEAIQRPNAPITETDVANYVARGIPHSPRIQVRGPVTVASVKYESASDTTSRIGVAVAVAGSTAVSVAELKGDFLVDQPYPARPAIQHTMYLVFDAQTGNLLNESVGP